MKSIKNYLFVFVGDTDRTGEQFFVQTNTLTAAWEVVADNFWGESIKYLGKYSNDEAEMMGFDTF